MPSVKHERHKFISLLNIIKIFYISLKQRIVGNIDLPNIVINNHIEKQSLKPGDLMKKENILDSFQKFQAR